MRESYSYIKNISFRMIVLCMAAIFCLTVLSCEKKETKQAVEPEQIIQTDETEYDGGDIQSIDFDKMSQIVENAKTLDVEVFFAISVLHRRYIKSLEAEAAGLSADQREKFYTEKKNEFFKTMKFSESQYNDFMTKNVDELNNYINQYPEITQYLTTDN